MSDAADKLSYFQAIIGVEDVDLCTEILTAHGWNLELAISNFTSTSHSDDNNPTTTSSVANIAHTSHNAGAIERLEQSRIVNNDPPGVIGFSNSARNGESSSGSWVPEADASSEARCFVSMFEREYGDRHLNFVPEGFMDVLLRSRREFKLMFVYLHSPDHPDTPWFCEETLCSEVLSAFINENFVAWGGSLKASEGFKMSNCLKASKFPFCAVVMAAANQRIALLMQVEGAKSPEAMLTVLQRALEESSTVLVAARLEAEECINNIRLREEQDAAYQAALEADQKEEDKAREKAAREAAEREDALVKLREEKASSLGPEPEKGPYVTQVLVRLPDGERKGRRFNCTDTIQSIYDFVDSSSSL
ncbi:hypothetical protein R6Q57_025301 [Mikania cordata]